MDKCLKNLIINYKNNKKGYNKSKKFLKKFCFT